MRYDDRFTSGFFAGLVGGIVMDILNYVSFLVNISNLRYLDWAAIVIYGHKPTSVLATLFALIAQLFFASIVGMVFAYLISKFLKSANHLFKGWVYGGIAYFVLYSVTMFFKMPGLTIIPTSTAISNFITSGVYGIVLAQMLYWFDSRLDIK